MRRFIFNLFIFLIITLLFNFVVFVFANDNYYKGYTDFPDKSYHSFIIADSHGLALEDFPDQLGVYNFSASSDSYLDMKRKVVYLIDNHYKVDKIYLTVDGHTLSPYRYQYNNSDKSIIYTSEVNFNYVKERYLKYYFPIFQVKVIPLLKIYLENKAKSAFQQKSKTANIIWSDLSEKERIKRAKERVVGQFPTEDKSEDLEKTLLEIIDLCKTNNIELIGLKFPLSRNYLDLMGKRNYGADMLFISKGLNVLDGESIFKNRDDYFGDHDHLNSKGAKVFIDFIEIKKTPLKK